MTTSGRMFTSGEKAPIVLERFRRSLKYNEVCMNDYESPLETRHDMERYIHLHNHYLPYQSLQAND